MEPLMIVTIARIAHEANRAYCFSMGDMSQPKWEDAPESQTRSAIMGVKAHLENPDMTPEQSHNNWLEIKRAEGWKYAPVKNTWKKEHPCFRPFSELPEEQKRKDLLFKNIVKSFIGEL